MKQIVCILIFLVSPLCFTQNINNIFPDAHVKKDGFTIKEKADDHYLVKGPHYYDQAGILRYSEFQVQKTTRTIKQYWPNGKTKNEIVFYIPEGNGGPRPIHSDQHRQDGSLEKIIIFSESKVSSVTLVDEQGEEIGIGRFYEPEEINIETQKYLDSLVCFDNIDDNSDIINDFNRGLFEEKNFDFITSKDGPLNTTLDGIIAYTYRKKDYNSVLLRRAEFWLERLDIARDYLKINAEQHTTLDNLIAKYNRIKTRYDKEKIIETAKSLFISYLDKKANINYNLDHLTDDVISSLTASKEKIEEKDIKVMNTIVDLLQNGYLNNNKDYLSGLITVILRQDKAELKQLPSIISLLTNIGYLPKDLTSTGLGLVRFNIKDFSKLSREMLKPLIK